LEENPGWGVLPPFALEIDLGDLGPEILWGLVIPILYGAWRLFVGLKKPNSERLRALEEELRSLWREGRPYQNLYEAARTRGASRVWLDSWLDGFVTSLFLEDQGRTDEEEVFRKRAVHRFVYAAVLTLPVVGSLVVGVLWGWAAGVWSAVALGIVTVPVAIAAIVVFRQRAVAGPDGMRLPWRKPFSWDEIHSLGEEGVEEENITHWTHLFRENGKRIATLKNDFSGYAYLVQLARAAAEGRLQRYRDDL
jgi:hypothetical protein